MKHQHTLAAAIRSIAIKFACAMIVILGVLAWAAPAHASPAGLSAQEQYVSAVCAVYHNVAGSDTELISWYRARALNYEKLTIISPELARAVGFADGMIMGTVLAMFSDNPPLEAKAIVAKRLAKRYCLAGIPL